MTSTEEATFIQLWQQGLDTREIGRQLGIPRGVQPGLGADGK